MFKMDRTVDARPGTANVRVTEYGWQGLLNPSPLNKEDNEGLVDEYLSPAKLQALTGVDDLHSVKALQMCVDTREHSLGHFGTYMPNLMQLKLNNSLIMSVRDLGTSLSHLQVLWMARCGLSDLDGISSLCSLKELYLAFNDLSEVSPVSMLEHLEVLDLEGNNLEQINELHFLVLCSKLTTLSLEGNPVCIKPSTEASEPPEYNYRAEVFKIIPHLRILDDIPANQMHTTSPRIPTPDWLMIKEYIKDNVGNQLGTGLGSENVQRRSSQRPSTAQSILSMKPCSALRPASAGRPVTSYHEALGSPRTDSSSVEEESEEDGASDLTHGVGRVICGNPIKALRARKERLTQSSRVTSMSVGHRPEHTYDFDVSSVKDCDVFAELKVWRKKHNIFLQRIQEDRAPQILTINHPDEEEGASSEEEKHRDPWELECLTRVSPDSPRQPLITQLPECTLNFGIESPDINWTPSQSKTSCPPASQSGIPGHNKGADLQTRHLLKGLQSGTMATRQLAVGTNIGHETCLSSCIGGNHSRMPGPLRDLGAGSRDRSVRPLSEPARITPVNARSPVDRNTPKVIPSHQPVIRSSTRTPERPAPPHIARPITAKGILQRLPNRPTLLIGNKSPKT